MCGVTRTSSYIRLYRTYTVHLSIISNVVGRAAIEEFITMHPHMAKEARVMKKVGPYNL